MQLFGSKKIKTNVLGKMGDYFLDLSKMIFAGTILTAIMDADLPFAFVFVGGFCATLFVLFWGIFFISLNNKE